MFASLILASAITVAGPATVADWRQACAGKEGWSDPAPPLHIFGNVYDVGTCGITVLLVTSPRGHILLDGATAEAAPAVAANIERLGFKLSDVKLIGASHEHLDHVGGIAELQRRSGATVMAMPAAFNTLETGVVDPADPQAGLHPAFPGAKVGRMLADRQIVRLGPLRLTAFATPGHSPGSTSWTWRSCEGRRCLRMVYADSLTAVSADAYRFTAHRRYVSAFRASIDRVGRLGCDLLITPHPGASRLIDRLAGKGLLVDPGACRAYANLAAQALDERLGREQPR